MIVTHPSADVPISYGLHDVKIDPLALNSVEVLWNADSDAGVFIKVNCISTEFTARKHGGEKGVPFRIQVETYASTADGRGANSNDMAQSRLLHCASCQVKVFKVCSLDDLENVSRNVYRLRVLRDLEMRQQRAAIDAVGPTRPQIIIGNGKTNW